MYKTPPRTIKQVFQSLPEGTWCQVINGRLVMSPPSYGVCHQSVCGDILCPLHNHIESHQLGELVMGPIDTYLDDENIFQPDLLFIANERLSIIKDYIYGAPDLVVEVLLPETENLDRIEKKEVYERFGVKEYWLVDPETKKVIGYQLTSNRFKKILSKNGKIVSSLLDLTVEF